MDRSQGGGFGTITPTRVKNLSDIRQASQGYTPFSVQPGNSSTSVFMSWTSQHTPSQGGYWEQQVASSSVTKQSTQYTKLAATHTLTDLTRANKALVKGGSDSLTPMKDSWHGKAYRPSAMLTATLMRVNETTTAFGHEAMGVPSHEVGSAMMAEALSRKWAAKNTGASVPSMGDTLSHLTEKFPQLDTTKKMRAQGEDNLLGQVSASRLNAAVEAGMRGVGKGLQSWEVHEYVQKKFNKHGLGELPTGWGEALRNRLTPQTK